MCVLKSVFLSLFLFLSAISFGQKELALVFDKIVSSYDVNIIYDISEFKDVKLNQIKIGKESAGKDIEAILKNTDLEFKQLTSKTFIIKRKESEIEGI